MTGDERRERLARATLYLCTPVRQDLPAFLDAVLAAGVDVVQLRDKDADARTQLSAARAFRDACDRHRALFVVNDRADLALAAGADGVHVGQDDLPPARARALVGPGLLVGLSTHAPGEIESAAAEPIDYLGVGPVNATPTKPGRPGVGLELLTIAARMTLPWFVTGGMGPTTIPGAVAAGARRFVVVRAITEAPDAAAAVRAIKGVIPRV